MECCDLQLVQLNEDVILSRPCLKFKATSSDSVQSNKVINYPPLRISSYEIISFRNQKLQLPLKSVWYKLNCTWISHC